MTAFADSAAHDLVDACMEAYRTCREAASVVADASTERRHALQDAADVDLLLADLLLRSSPHARTLLPVARAVNAACASAVSSGTKETPALRVAYAACCRVQDACDGWQNGEEPADAQREEALRETFPASDAPPPPTQL